MTKSKNIRPPRPTYSGGFKNGAVELYQTRRREHANETPYAATVAVSETMGVTAMTIRNWVNRAEDSAAQALAEQPASPGSSAEASTPADAAFTALVAVLGSPDLSEEAELVRPIGAAEAPADDPQATILDLRRQVSELRRANVILKNATAYLASEALKAA
ncbi:MAG TPA: hypothetical protein VF867_14155 [Arthrobacter sp.]